MRYIFNLLISTLFLTGAEASDFLAETTRLTSQVSSINSSEPTIVTPVVPRIKMSEEGTSRAEKVGDCFGRFLACWNKDNPEDDDTAYPLDPMASPKGKGTKALLVGGAVSMFATLSAFCSGGWCMICGYGRCCFNSDLFCIKLIGAGCCDGSCCGYVCGNAGCIKAGCVSFMAAGGACGLTCCCFMSICLCRSMGTCDQSCDKLGMTNCAKGFRAGYRGKKEGPIQKSDRPQMLYQNQTSGI